MRISLPAGLCLTSSPGVPGCKVLKAAPGNGGYNAGVKARDVILAVNGMAVSDHKMAVKLIESSSFAGEAILTISTQTQRSPSRLSRFLRSEDHAPAPSP